MASLADMIADAVIEEQTYRRKCIDEAMQRIREGIQQAFAGMGAQIAKDMDRKCELYGPIDRKLRNIYGKGRTDFGFIGFLANR